MALGGRRQEGMDQPGLEDQGVSFARPSSAVRDHLSESVCADRLQMESRGLPFDGRDHAINHFLHGD